MTTATVDGQGNALAPVPTHAPQAPAPAAPAPAAATPAPAPAQPAGNTTTTANPDDIDAKALATARAAADAEDRASGKQPPPQGGQQQQPAQQPKGKTPSVPKPRFDEVSQAYQAAAAERDYYRGAFEALKASPPAATPQPATAPAAPQPQPQLQAIESQIIGEQQKVLAAAKRFDEGEISLSQFKETEIASGNMIASLRERVMLAQIRAEAPKPQVGLSDQAVLDKHLAEMEAAHPWVSELTPAEIEHLVQVVRHEQAALGRPIGASPAETIRLRQGVAELSDVFGPRWYPNKQPRQAPAAAPSAQQPQPTTAAPASAPQQRGQAGRAKLELAAQHPPNVQQAGTPAVGTQQVTEADIAKMSTDEIAALPREMRQRYL